MHWATMALLSSALLLIGLSQPDFAITLIAAAFAGTLAERLRNLRPRRMVIHGGWIVIGVTENRAIRREEGNARAAIVRAAWPGDRALMDLPRQERSGHRRDQPRLVFELRFQGAQLLGTEKSGEIDSKREEYEGGQPNVAFGNARH